jgi:uncharacterized membrane protein
VPTPTFLYVIPALIMFISLPLVLKKIPKNSLYGFRTPRTMSGTDEYWYQANQRAGFAMFLAGIVSFLAGLVIPLFVSDKKETLSVWTFVLLASLIAAVCFSLWRESKISP